MALMPVLVVAVIMMKIVAAFAVVALFVQVEKHAQVIPVSVWIRPIQLVLSIFVPLYLGLPAGRRASLLPGMTVMVENILLPVPHLVVQQVVILAPINKKGTDIFFVLF
jgi:hypothetical protein